MAQSQKDAKEKRELKQIINMIAKYINSLDSYGALPLVQTPESFDPTSLDSRRLLNQIQRGKAITIAMDEWADSVLKKGKEFLQ